MCCCDGRLGDRIQGANRSILGTDRSKKDAEESLTPMKHKFSLHNCPKRGCYEPDDHSL